MEKAGVPLTFAVTALALVVSADARSECHDGLRPRLATLAAGSREALQALATESTRAARRVDGAIQDLDGGLEAIRSLRPLNCAQLRGRGTELRSQAVDPYLVGDARLLLQLQFTYVFYRRMACRARDAKLEWVPALASEEPAAARSALSSLAEMREAFLETLPRESAAGEAWIAARDGIRSALSPVPGLLEELRAACASCLAPEGTSGPSPAARRLSDVTVRIVHGLGPGADGAPSEDAEGDAEEDSDESGPGGAVRAPARERPETADERLLRLRRARTRSAVREAREREREEDGPARLRSRAELMALSRSALTRAVAEGGRIPGDLDWALLRAELDARERRPRPSQGDFDSDRERWRETIDRLREIATQETDPTLRLTRAARLVAAEYLAIYTEANGSPLDAFSGAGANCQVSTTLLVSALSEVPGLVPAGYELGIQVFNGHVQAVVVPSDPADTRVWDLLTNTRTERREAPVYRPALAIRGYLETEGVRTGVTTESLLLREASPDRTRGLAAPAAATVADSQGWAEVAPDVVFSAAPNPAHAVLTLPVEGEPAPVSRTPAVTVVPAPLPPANPRPAGADANPADAGADDLDAEIEALEARITDPAVRAAYDDGLVFLEEIQANPGIRSAELAASARARLYRELAGTGRARGNELRTAADRIVNDCRLLAALGRGCAGDPVVAEGVRRIERRFDGLLRDPGRLIAGIDAAEEMQATLRTLGGRGTAGQPARRELERLGRSAIFPDAALSLAGASIVAGGRDFDILDAESSIEDGTAAARLLDYVADPANVAPSLGAGRRATGAGRGRGTVAAPGARATYEIGPEIYRDYLLQYAAMRAGHVSEREDALWRAISVPPEDDAAARRFTVCGDFVVSEWDVTGILDAARAIHPDRPSLPCPGGASEEEYRALDGAYWAPPNATGVSATTGP